MQQPEFDPAAGFWAFVEIVAARRCVDWLRSQKTTAVLSEGLVDARNGPLGDTLEHERLELASETLAGLEEPCRKLIYLHAGLAKSYGEISSLLGKSEGALRVQMYRCLQAARRVRADLEVPGRAKQRKAGHR